MPPEDTATLPPGTVAVDAATLDLLTRSHKVLNTLNGNPQARAHLEDSLKVVFPDVKTEREVAADLTAPVIAQLEEKLKPVIDTVNSIAADRDAAIKHHTEVQLASAFDEMRRTRGFTDEGIEQVKKLMVDRNIADPQAAAALFAEQNPPQTQEAPSWAPQHWSMEQTTGGDADSLKQLFADEDRWADNMVGQALNEHRAQVNRIAVG